MEQKLFSCKTASALYRKLICLYPRGFRQQFSESMEQTFHDLYKERQTARGRFGFVLWILIETTIGIIQERVLSIKEMNPMNNIVTNLRLPALISFLIMLPFTILEWATRSNAPSHPRSNLDITGYVTMWFLPA